MARYGKARYSFNVYGAWVAAVRYGTAIYGRVRYTRA